MRTKSYLNLTGKKIRLTVCATILLGGSMTSALSQTTNIIMLTNSDALGTSSFNAVGNWDSGAAPVSGSPDFNAFFTTNFNLRTPTGSGDYTFAGDSLEVDSGGMGFKGSGTITVSNLILNGGKIANAGTGGVPDTALLAGSINVIANSSFDGGGAAGVTAFNVLAPISGSGGITIQDNGTVIFSATNTYLGNTTVNTNGTLKMNVINAIPHGSGTGFLTLSGGTPSGAVLDLNGFDTAANDITSGGGVVPAQIVNSAAGTTNTLTVDTELANKTYKGYIKDNGGTGGVLALALTSFNGSGAWTISSNLTYSGDTTINSGRLKMGASGNLLPWGSGKGNVIVNNNGILDLQGRSPQINGLLGDGTVDNVTGIQGVGGHATFNCGSNDVSCTFSGAIQNSFYDGTDAAPLGNPTNCYIQVSKFGAGTYTWTGVNTFVGNLNIHNGVLRITQQNGDGSTGGGLGLGNGCPNGNWPNFPGKVVSIDSSLGDAGVHFLATNGSPIVVSSDISFQTAGTNGTIVNEAGDNIINGSISLRSGGGTTIRVDGDTLTLAGNINILTNVSSRTLTLSGVTNGIVSGIISDGSSANVPNTNLLSLAKSGAGVWMLSTNNTYSDVTTINAGTLVLDANGSISNTPAIILQNNATFNVSSVSGGWKLLASQTLSGSGNVAGNVTANGIVSPGTSTSIGALNFSNQLTLANSTLLKLNRTNSSANADSLTAVTLVRGGTLTVTNTGDPLQVGDSFNLLNGTLSGVFAATNLPSLSAPLFWDTSLLGGQGKITVGSTGPGVFTNKTGITGFALSGANIVITGTNGQSGDAYYLLQSTNVALPLSQWTVAATNVLNVNGNFTFTGTNVVIPGGRQQFYILSNTNSNH